LGIGGAHKSLIVYENTIRNVGPEVLVGTDVIFIEVGRTDQTLFLVGADVQFMLANRLILAAVVDLCMVMQGRPRRKCNEKHPQQNK
jgi:hypothetical protein